MCDSWKSGHSAFKRAELETLLVELSGLGVREAIITGGEPFHYHLLADVLARVWDQAPQLTTAIITNGSRRDSVAEEILASKSLRRVHVSLDALNDDGARAVRGRERWYSGVVDFVALARRSPGNLTIVCNAILNKHNRSRLHEYFMLDVDFVNFLNLKGSFQGLSLSCRDEAELARTIGFAVSSRKLWPRIFALGGRLDGTISEKFFEHIWGRIAERRPCLVTSVSTFIDSRGDVFACNCLTYGRSAALGNVLSDRFAAVWNGQRAQNIRQECLRECWKTCTSCDPANRLYNLVAASQSRSVDHGIE